MLQEADATTSKGTGRQATIKRRGDKQQTVVASLLMVAKQTRALASLKFAEIGLAAGQDQLLLAADATTPLAVSTLAEELCVRPSTVSKMVDRLVEKDFLVRSSDPSDHRKVGVRLTAAGVAMQTNVRSVLAEFETELQRGLNEDADETLAALDKLDRILTSRLRRLR